MINSYEKLFLDIIYCENEIENQFIEDVFNVNFEPLNSREKIDFLTYFKSKIEENSFFVWGILMEEHFYQRSQNKRKMLLYEVEGYYMKHNETTQMLLLGRQEGLEKLVKSIPEKIKNEKKNLKSQNSLNPSKRGGFYSFKLIPSKIDLNILRQKLIDGKLIEPSITFVDFANIFNRSNISTNNKVVWLGNNSELLGLFKTLDEKELIDKQDLEWAITKIIAEIFVQKNGESFNSKHWASQYSKVINRKELQYLSLKNIDKFSDLVNSSLYPL